jgi:hypothetical protein
MGITLSKQAKTDGPPPPTVGPFVVNTKTEACHPRPCPCTARSLCAHRLLLAQGSDDSLLVVRAPKKTPEVPAKPKASRLQESPAQTSAESASKPTKPTKRAGKKEGAQSLAEVPKSRRSFRRADLRVVQVVESSATPTAERPPRTLPTSAPHSSNRPHLRRTPSVSIKDSAHICAGLGSPHLRRTWRPTSAQDVVGHISPGLRRIGASQSDATQLWAASRAGMRGALNTTLVAR